jgi:hypothetical protein
MTDAAPGASGTTGASSEPGSAAGSTGGSSEPGSAPTGATFTQEQVDRFVARERQKFSDYDETKKRLAELESASQTELERAQQAKSEADARASTAMEQRNRLLVRSAVTAEAARAGALDPDIVVALLADSIAVDDKGEITGDVKALVSALLDEKPFLKNGAQTIGSADGGSHGRASTTGASTPSGGMDELLRKSR